MATSDADEEGDRLGDVTNTHNGDATYVVQAAGDVNLHQHPGPADDLTDKLIASKDEVIASQRRELARYEEQRETYQAQLDRILRQRTKARTVIRSLDYVSVRLELARSKCQDELRTLGARPGILASPDAKARRQLTESRLRDIEKLLADAASELRRAENGAALAQRLDSAIQAGFEDEHPDHELPEDVPVAVADPARTTLTDDNLLDRARSVVDQSQADNNEIEQNLDQVASTLPATLATPLRITPSDRIGRTRDRRRKGHPLRESPPRQLKVAEPEQESADSPTSSSTVDAVAIAVVSALAFLVPVIGMLASGVLLHAVPKLQAASSTEHTVVLGLAALLFGVPIVWLYFWSKESPGYVTTVATALWIGGVVAGYYYAGIAVMIAALLLAVVGWTRKIGLVPIVGAGVTVLLGAIAPGFLWWSWTTLGGLSDLF